MYMYIHKEIYYEGLARVTMEAEKPHDLTSASWRPGTASGVIPVKSTGPRTRRASVQMQEKTDVPAQGERATLPFL